LLLKKVKKKILILYQKTPWKKLKAKNGPKKNFTTKYSSKAFLKDV